MPWDSSIMLLTHHHGTVRKNHLTVHRKLICYSTMDHPCSNDVGSVATQNRENLNYLQLSKQLDVNKILTILAWYKPFLRSNDKVSVVWIMMSPRRRYIRHKQYGWYMVIQHPLLRYFVELITMTMKVVARGTWPQKIQNIAKQFKHNSRLYKLPREPMLFTPPADTTHQKYSDTWNFSSDQTL